jgi:tRNA (guanine37-N1)-methyltransferase
MHIEVVTLFPALIQDALRHGVLGRAVERGLISVGTVDPRSFAQDAHRTVDDRPYGGGPGMVLKPEPLCAAIDTAAQRAPVGSLRVALSAQGQLLTQSLVAQWALLPGLVLIAGRYEGIDERVLQLSVDQRGVDRRLCGFGRRNAGAGADRCDGAAATGRARRCALERGRVLR